MKTFLRYFLILIVALLYNQSVFAQAKPFNKGFVFDKLGGQALSFPLSVSLSTKTPDDMGFGNIYQFDGSPSRAQVVNTLFVDNNTSRRFYVTKKSDEKLSFQLNFGTEVLGDIIFDKITVSEGDYGYSETLEVPLTIRPDFCVGFGCASNFYCGFTKERNQVHRNSDFDYTTELIIRMYQKNQVVKTIILPIMITGEFEEYLSTGPGPIELHTILRALPGDKSVVFLEKSSKVSNEVKMSVTELKSTENKTTASVSVGIKAGPFKAGGSVEGSTSTKDTEVKGKENTYLSEFTATDRIENRNEEGDFSDLFIAEKRLYQYGVSYTIYPDNNGKQIFVKTSSKLLFYPGRRIGQYYETEKKLLNKTIPALEAAGELSEAKFWKDLIKSNNDYKQLAKKSTPEVIKASTNGSEKSITVDRTQSFTVSSELSIENTKSLKIEVEAGFELGPIEAGVKVSKEKTWVFNTTHSNAQSDGKTESNTIGYKIADDDFGDGDKLVIKVWEDVVVGSPVWELDEKESITSCPYEGGFQADQPSITVVDPVSKKEVKSAKYSEIQTGKEVVFDVNVKNLNTKNARTYVMRYEPNGQRPNVTIPGGLNGVVPPFLIKAGETQKLSIKISNSSDTPQPYKDLMFILEPKCGGSDNDGYVSDTIMLSAFYGDTDTNRVPDNNNIFNAFVLPTDGSLQTTYKNKFGTLSKITNKNATTVAEEKALVPPTDCQKGWCAETADGKAEITNPVWFKFKAVSLNTIISTCDKVNAGFNTQIAAFKVGDINKPSTFTRLGANDKGSCSGSDNALLSLENLTLGDTIYVMVDGFKGAQADFGVSVKALPPDGDIVCKQILLAVDGVNSKKYSNIAATIETNENVLTPKSTDSFYGWKVDSIQHSVWFKFTAPPGGEVVIDVLNATFDAQVAVFDQGRTCDSEFFSQWTLMGANDDISISGGNDSRLVLKGLKKGAPYGILVDGYKGAMGTFNVKLSIPIPTNDDPCNAISLETTATGQGVFSNGGATSSTAEQSIAPPTVDLDKPNGWSDKANDSRARKIEKSVWFKFIAPSEGAVQISACNQANFQLQMALYRTIDCNDFSKFKLIAADDNSQLCRIPPNNEYPNGTNVRGSILNLKGLEADSTYYLLIDGAVNDYGQFSIDILTTPANPPVNDEACKAIALPTNGQVQKGFSNLSATVSKTEYKITPKEWLDKNMGGTVWFTFVAPATGEVEISTCDLANFDTQLAVFKVADCKIDSNFVFVAANEDGPKNCATNGDSFLPIKGLTAGQMYYLVVDGYGINRGNFSIVIKDKITPGPANDDVTNAILLPVNGVIQKGFTNSLATVQDKEQNIRPKPSANQDCTTGWCDNQVDNSVWFKFVAPADGKVNISTCDLADFDTQLAIYSATNVADFTTFTLKGANDAGPVDCSTFFDSYLPVTGLIAGQTYYILVDGFDGDNGKFDIKLSGTADTQAPTTPTTLAATDTQSTSVSISWTAATDNTGVKEYEVYVDGTSVGKTSETKFTISNLKPTTAYTITVVANDAAGNASAASTAIKVTTTAGADTQAPSSPTALTVTENKSTTVSISWTPATDNVGIKEYTIYLDGALIGTTSDTKFTIPNLTASTAYSVTIVAKDAAGNASPASSALKITTATAGDTQAPSSPTALTITETKSTSVSISWTAATDNVGVKEYAVYVDGALIGTTSETKFTIPNLTPATAYTVSIIAKDEAGNASPASAALKITTAAVVVADTQAPTSPTNLLASVIKTNSIKISWTAATDNVGIKEYKLYLDGTFNASTTATTFDITGLTSATAYSIYITAIDAAGNISPNSTVLKVTTLADIELSIGPDNIETYQVYPNPFDNQVNINITDFDEKKGSIEIRNVSGNIISAPTYKIDQNGTLSINTDNLPSGVLTLIVKSNGKSYIKKIVKF